jgi:hypothetical protein
MRAPTRPQTRVFFGANAARRSILSGVAIEHVSEGATHRLAGLGNLLICLYWGQPPVDALRDRIEWVERTIAKGLPVGLLVVITEDAAGQLPGRPFRQESKRQAEAYRGHVLFSASVVEGTRVTAVLVRSFLRSLATVVARGIQVRFFDDAREGARWAAELLEPHDGPSEAAILAAVQALRPEPPTEA